MALAHTILALLIESPRSGYDLMKSFDSSVGFFWKATHQQVYRELAKLEEQGWIDPEVVPQEGRPDKKVYSVTTVGRQALTAWIGQPCEVMPVKEELLVKIFVGDLVAPEILRQEVERHRVAHQQKLAVYWQIEAIALKQDEPEKSATTVTLQLQFQYLTLRRGIRYETDCIAWCDEVLTFLATLEESKSE